MQGPAVVPGNMLQVVNRCFQILQSRAEESWRKYSDVIISPDVPGVAWDGFESGAEMIKAGELAAEAILPQIKIGWNRHMSKRPPTPCQPKHQLSFRRDSKPA